MLEEVVICWKEHCNAGRSGDMLEGARNAQGRFRIIEQRTVILEDTEMLREVLTHWKERVMTKEVLKYCFAFGGYNKKSLWRIVND